MHFLEDFLATLSIHTSSKLGGLFSSLFGDLLYFPHYAELSERFWPCGVYAIVSLRTVLYRIFSTPFADFHNGVTQQLRNDGVSATQSSLHGTDGMTQQLRDGGSFMTTCTFKFKIYSTESWLEAEVNTAIQSWRHTYSTIVRCFPVQQTIRSFLMVFLSCKRSQSW